MQVVNQSSIAVVKPLKMQKAKPTINSTLVSRNVTVCGHRTSVRLEPDMWRGLIEICNREKTNQHKVCSMIAEAKPEATSLTAAIRVFIMSYFRAAATEDGHNRAGHGHGMLGNTIENITRAPVASPTAINGTMARVTSTMPYIIGASIKSPPVNR